MDIKSMIEQALSEQLKKGKAKTAGEGITVTSRISKAKEKRREFIRLNEIARQREELINSGIITPKQDA